MSGDALAISEVEGRRISSKIGRARGRSEEAKTNCRAAVNRDENVEVRQRDRAKAKRICDSM